MHEIVEFNLTSGARIKARLVKENDITAVVKPLLWIKTKEISIHKKKSQMRKTGEVT